MITRIAATRVSSSETPTCNSSKSRETMQHHTKITNLATTSIPAGQRIAVRHATRNRTAATMRRCSLAALQVLVLACALPPPLQPLLPALLPTPTRWSFAVEALPITSKPIEGTAENLAWQAWLMLPPEQKQLEKSRKVTPKSIFSLPFRDCPPGHQLFQSRCIPTVNINQSDLLAQQVLGLLVGSTAGGAGGTGNDNAYEFDYEDEEYGLGFGEGEPMVMYESPQPFSSGSNAGSGNEQQPPARDEPLKFNLFEQKYPTSDYEADISSSGLEGSGGARPLNEPLPTHMSPESDRVGASANDSDAGATFFNSSQFLDAVQGFFQRHNTASDESTANTTMRNVTTTDQSIRIANASNTDRQGLSDLHVASSNISTFAVGDIDAIILPAVGSGMSTTISNTSAGDGGGGSGGASATGGNLEPQRISLFKDDSTVQLVTTVIGQSDSNKRGGGEDAIRDDVGDLVTAAQQQHNSIAQFLRADALLPLSSAAPYITTTVTSFAADDADHGTKTPPLAAKDERPRSVTQRNFAAAAAPADTDAQETSFITTTEPEGTTSFQIDETTVVEASDESATAPEPVSLLEAISKQQQLEFQKSKVEPVEDEAPITTTTFETAISEETITADDDNTTTETKTIASETDETTTAKEVYEMSEKVVESTAATETTTQPLPSAVELSSTIIATTTLKSHLTTTPSSDRFRSTPAAAVAPIRLATEKQVSTVVTSATAPATDSTIVEETAASSIDVVSDVPRSGNNDLVNAATSSINSKSDTNNDSNKNKNNKKSPVRIAASTKATVAANELNIEQELRMINELVKGKRQLAALKMAAIKATTTQASTTTTAPTTTSKLPTASEPKLEMKKFANAAENKQNARGVAAVEVRRDVDEAITTTQVATITAETTTVVNSPLVTASGSENEVLQTTTATTTTGGTKAATQTEATATSTATAKMESGGQIAETTTVEYTTATEALSKIIELATTTTTTIASAEPDFEAEATAASAEATGATLWSRIMPIFGFGGTAVETGAVVGAGAGAAPTSATTTAVPAAEEIVGSASIGSISSNSNDRSGISSDSISDISSIGKNINNSNSIRNNNKHFDGHIRRNSKIIRIDQLSDNSLAAAAAATTNTLEEEESTAMNSAAATKTTTAMANTKPDSFAVAPVQEPAEQSSYWWLPAGWRSLRDTNAGQQPLLFRLWSAFPESQMKAKVRT